MRYNLKNKKTLTFLLVSVLAFGIASGALVNYLSNQVEADVQVSSPIELKITTDGYGWEESISLGNTTGGSTVTYSIKEEVLANNPITSTVRTNVTADEGVDNCSEIDDVVVKNKGTGDTVGKLGNNINCTYDSNALLLDMKSENATETNEYAVNTTFADGATGNYSVGIQHVI